MAAGLQAADGFRVGCPQPPPGSRLCVARGLEQGTRNPHLPKWAGSQSLVSLLGVPGNTRWAEEDGTGAAGSGPRPSGVQKLQTPLPEQLLRTSKSGAHRFPAGPLEMHLPRSRRPTFSRAPQFGASGETESEPRACHRPRAPAEVEARFQP